MSQTSQVPLLVAPPWMLDSQFQRGDWSIAGVQLSVTREEVELVLERVAIMTAEGVAEAEAQTEALCQLNQRCRTGKAH